MVPVCNAWKNNVIEVLEDVLKGRAFHRRICWQCGAYFTRLALGKYRIPCGCGEVICDPINERVAVLPKGFGIHVA